VQPAQPVQPPVHQPTEPRTPPPDYVMSAGSEAHPASYSPAVPDSR
jgi:hypothetical protein